MIDMIVAMLGWGAVLALLVIFGALVWRLWDRTNEKR